MNSVIFYLVDFVVKIFFIVFFVFGINGFLGIVEYQFDQFVVIGGGKFIYKVDFFFGIFCFIFIKIIIEVQNFNGLVYFDNLIVFVVDVGCGNVYKIDVNMGVYFEVVCDLIMVLLGGIFFGIDGICYVNGMLWYINIFCNLFYKIFFDFVMVKSMGVQIIFWINFMGDDFCFGFNGKIYVIINSRNFLVEVDLMVVRFSFVSVGIVMGSMSCVFGWIDRDRNVVYVGGGQGVFVVIIWV